MRIGFVSSGGPRPVAPVNCAVHVKKNHAPGLIVVELKQIQVKPVGLDDAYADELFFQSFKLLVLTNNLLVDSFAGRSGDSAKKREKRFS